MKNFILPLCAATAAVCVAACDFDINRTSQPSTLFIHFDSALAKSVVQAVEALPDTNDFILTVSDASGNTIYNGKFGDSPLKLTVTAGTYTVRAVSCLFDEPLFDAPQYGDEQVVSVPSGTPVSVKLDCSQINSGIRIVTKPGFRTQFPEGVLYLKSSQGQLMYGYAEKRTAFFKPGAVSLELVDGDSRETLLSRNLSACQMLTLSLNANPDASQQERISIQLDTARVWTQEDFQYGGGAEGEDRESAVSVQRAKEMIGSQNVWVYGYIVGVCTTTAKSEYAAPFSMNTNILLSSRSVVSDRKECISVELPKGDVRDALNLKDNPENLGRQVILKGNLVDSYYGLPGLKTTLDFAWK